MSGLSDAEREYGQPNEHDPAELLFDEHDVERIIAARLAAAEQRVTERVDSLATLVEVARRLAAILGIALAATLFFLVVMGMGAAQMLDAERKLTDRYKWQRDEARALNLPADTLGTGNPASDGLAVERLADDLDAWGRS